MSDALKRDLAQELGVADVVAHEGWGGVSARNCGNLVKLAVMRAEEALARDYSQGRSFASSRAFPERFGGAGYGEPQPTRGGLAELFPY